MHDIGRQRVMCFVMKGVQTGILCRFRHVPVMCHVVHSSMSLSLGRRHDIMQVGLIATPNFHLYADGVLTCDPVTESDPSMVCAATARLRIGTAPLRGGNKGWLWCTECRAQSSAGAGDVFRALAEPTAASTHRTPPPGWMSCAQASQG